jgi:hypothetical protein
VPVTVPSAGASSFAVHEVVTCPKPAARRRDCGIRLSADGGDRDALTVAGADRDGRAARDAPAPGSCWTMVPDASTPSTASPTVTEKPAVWSVCVAWSIVMPMTDGRSVSWRFVRFASGDGKSSPPYFAFAAPCISGQIELRMRERT